jgi:hypothetical protein
MKTPSLKTPARPKIIPPESSPYTQYGLALGRPILRSLEKRGVNCQTSISLEHQSLAKRYILRGTESGGAVSDMARYCAYFGLDGLPLPWLQPLDSLSGNGRHAVVLAEEFVRVDMLRIGRTYELAVSKHTLAIQENKQRPKINSELLFRGQQGSLAVELWRPENRDLRGNITPVFYTLAGETRQVPKAFEGPIRVVTGALSCVGCKHTHVAIPPQPQLIRREARHGIS